VTSPASGTGSAPDLPDYAPIPRSAFLTTRDGVVLFDAPPSIGGNPWRLVDEITAANGVPNTVTHLVYSHHHAGAPPDAPKLDRRPEPGRPR